MTTRNGYYEVKIDHIDGLPLTKLEGDFYKPIQSLYTNCFGGAVMTMTFENKGKVIKKQALGNHPSL